MTTKVKICGITRQSDAQLAFDLGAWAIGMIMWPESPRHCDQGTATQIARDLRRDLEVAGVFVNQQLDEVAALADVIDLSIIQLHGDEGPAYCEEVARRTGCDVIKATRVRDQSDLQQLGQFNKVAYHLLDSYKAGVPGGTGTTFDWKLARNYTREVPVVMSGGLHADNVIPAIETVSPFAVDVASGVEQSPGVKDQAKMKAFFRAVATTSEVVA